MIKKTCNQCGKVKPLDSFYYDQRYRYQCKNSCIECLREYAMARYHATERARRRVRDAARRRDAHQQGGAMPVIIRSATQLRKAVAHLLMMSRAQEAAEFPTDFNRGHSAGRNHAYTIALTLIDALIEHEGTANRGTKP